jgi:SsrA-binding protein
VAGRSSDRRFGGDDEQVNIAVNRKAFHDFSVEERYEAGIVLTGTEVKSLRAGRLTIGEGYVRVYRDEVWLESVHIPPYEHGTYQNHEPRRTRKLLLRRIEIRRLADESQARGYTLVPLRMYWKSGRAKVEIGVARGKRNVDKREAIAERDARRDMDRAVADRYRRGLS